MEHNDIKNQKSVEFYASAVTAWYATRLEYDKSLLTLSAGGIGLLITLLTTVGVSSFALLVLYLVAMLSFLVCLIVIPRIFNKNSDHIEAVILSNENMVDPSLVKLDKIAKWSFRLGVIFSFAIGCCTAYNSYLIKEKELTADNKHNPTPTNRTFANESFYGISNLNPMGKSFNGVSNLNPASAPKALPTTPTASQVPVANPSGNKK